MNTGRICAGGNLDKLWYEGGLLLMEQANLLVNTHSAAIIIVLLLIVLVALGMCFSLQGKLNKLQKKYDFFTQGKEANIDVVLTDTLLVIAALESLAIHARISGAYDEDEEGFVYPRTWLRYLCFGESMFILLRLFEGA